MRKSRDSKVASHVRRRNTRVSSGISQAMRGRFGKRTRGAQRNECQPYSPPEDWHEPAPSSVAKQDPYDFRIVVQPSGAGYQHVLTPDEVRQRLRELPPEFVAPLEVVQLSRMTKKKTRFACYGMQWGASVYLYPLEADRIERHGRSPKPIFLQDASMYGGRWVQVAESEWHLIWPPDALKDFYLNNILIHELGHLLDQRNSSFADRERFAEWFALEYGYKRTRRISLPNRRKVKRRHHCC